MTRQFYLNNYYVVNVLRKVQLLASFLYLIAVLIPMVMGRFLIDLYTISLFTSIREEQGLNMEAVYSVYRPIVNKSHQKKEIIIQT
jgi:hypothetical protein